MQFDVIIESTDATLTDVPIRVEVVTGPIQVEVQSMGARGPKGEDGSLPAETESMVAGESLSALRVVRGDDNGKAYYCTLAWADLGRALGVTKTSAGINTAVTVLTNGIMEDSGWNWDTTKPVWLGPLGVLTQTPQTLGYHQVIGTPESPTKLKVSIHQPVRLQYEGD